METRDILNWLNEKVGEMSQPDDTSEEIWSAALAPYAVQPPDQSELLLNFDIQKRKIYAEDLLSRFKKRNISDGINAAQGLWMHHRMRANDITFGGQSRTIDVLNLAISGDIEIACLTMIYTTPDDMSQSYHWLSSARIGWLVADMKSFLGW